jgi:4-alpha-glucanotransferase
VVPDGAPPSEGAFLTNPMTDLLRLLALESVRNNAIVIGEDLGTVPEGFQETLEQAGVHGMRVLWFERDGQAGFVPPRAWGSAAVAMTSTHDLPTVAGWWTGGDIDTRREHGRLADSDDPDAMHAERDQDRRKLWDAFARAHVAEGPAPSPHEPAPAVDAALRFVALTDSPLSLFPIEDLLGQAEQPNLPGTTTEHPNWRRRLPFDADSLLDQPDVARRVDAIANDRPRQ